MMMGLVVGGIKKIKGRKMCAVEPTSANVFITGFALISFSMSIPRELSFVAIMIRNKKDFFVLFFIFFHSLFTMPWS